MSQSIAAESRGQDVYVGIDTHRKSWTVCILADERERKPFNQSPEPLTLLKHLEKHHPGRRYHLAYEAGFAGNWIARSFAELGVDCIVVHAPDIPATQKERWRKSDARDCRKIARELRGGKLEALYVPARQAEEDRQFVRSRTALMRKQTRVKNQIKSLLAFSGQPLPERSEMSHWSGSFINWLETLFDDRPSLKATLAIYVAELKWHRQQLASMLKQLRVLGQSERFARNVELLRTVPGIALLSAMIMLSELIDIRRFSGFDHLASYVGFIPDTRGSGEKVSTTGITSRRNSELRPILIECAWVAIRKDPELAARYRQDCQRMIPAKAIVRTARKLLSRIHHVLRLEEPYRIAAQTSAVEPDVALETTVNEDSIRPTNASVTS
jgi:transposase